MEATGPGAPNGGPAPVTNGSTSELATPSAYDEDSRHSLFAITASQVPKPTGSTAPTPPGAGTGADGALKDVKSLGTRFHEDCLDTDLPSPRLRSSRMFKGKGKEGIPLDRQRKKPLRLLDLPMDILKDIVKEVTHTNDLTSMALCHSALHRLAIPHIYSRFDIVWPDSNTHAEPRSGVDALTYGLATLVMAEEIFGEAPAQRTEHSNRFAPSGQGRASDLTVRRRRGNHYAQFTRKFSLGNGPADWVQEYLITKEGGKMLGTLVALAVARMRSLETFIWDMPTGILRDVWLALSSLGDRDDGQPCKLEKVWVRWHDNSTTETPSHLPPPPPTMDLNAVSTPPTINGVSFPTAILPPQIHPAALDRVEHPSFSVLPPLKSLSVLDIDELAYLDEMAVLIGRSLDKLRELRVGIARIAKAKDWVTVWEGEQLRQVDGNYPIAGSLTIGERRLGGVLGILTGFVCDMRKPKIPLPDRTKCRELAKPSTSAPEPAVQADDTPASSDALAEQGNDLRSLTSLHEVLPDISIPTSATTSQSRNMLYENDPLIATGSHASSPLASSPLQTPATPTMLPALSSPSDPVLTPASVEGSDIDITEAEQHSLNNTLHLETLELERVPLSVPVLQKAIDWTLLTSLTLLHCQNHEQLWKTLRRSFAPTPRSPTYPQPRRTPSSTSRKGSKALIAGSDIELEYSLNLKKVHTNAVSPALISFLKDTLAPNSLETLFLQECRSYSSSVTVDQIYKGPLRRHRNSLKKILIDSSEKGSDGVPINSSRWRRWMLNREILSFMCSGKMPVLRELGMAIDYRDWHFFLQHLPNIPHLRSLYIPFLADHVHGANADARELALQVVDIVALRLEVELCYMGIANKCFEVLENRRDWDASPGGRADNGGAGGADGVGGVLHGATHGGTVTGMEDGASEAEDEEDEEDDVADEMDDVVEEVDETESDDDDDDDEDDDVDAESDDGGNRDAARLRLREILFYDDKVAVFKARHGRL